MRTVVLPKDHLRPVPGEACAAKIYQKAAHLP